MKINGQKIVKYIGYVVKIGSWILNSLKFIPAFTEASEGIKREAQRECEDCSKSFQEALKEDRGAS